MSYQQLNLLDLLDELTSITPDVSETSGLELMLERVKEEFVFAAEAIMKEYWRASKKSDRTPYKAFAYLFSHLYSPKLLVEARLVMVSGVHAKALGDFYNASYARYL